MAQFKELILKESLCGKPFHSAIKPSDIEMYMAWTNFRKNEVLKIEKVWTTLRDAASRAYKDGAGDDMESKGADLTQEWVFTNDMDMDVCPVQALIELPAIRTNPYKDRIFEAFAEDATGNLTFDEFLDCCAHFSPRTTKAEKLKAVYRVYDFDCDGLLGKRDVAQVIKLMYGNETAKYNVDDIDFDEIADHVVNEADLDETGYLGFVEFTKILAGVQDFERNMNIRFLDTDCGDLQRIMDHKVELMRQPIVTARDNAAGDQPDKKD